MYNYDFQRSVIKLICNNVTIANVYGSHIKMTYFETIELREIYKIALEYVVAYNKEICLEELEILIHDQAMIKGYDSRQLEVLLAEARAIFSKNINSEKFIIDKIVTFCKREETRLSILEIMDKIDDDTIYEKFQSMADKIGAIGVEQNHQMSIRDLYEVPKLYKQFYNPSNLAQTGFPNFDNTFMGGFAPGEVHVVMGAPKAGKTTLACNIGKNVVSTLNRGEAVFHASLEISSLQVLIKYAQVYTGMTIPEIINMPHDNWVWLLDQKIGINSRLFVNYWSKGTASAFDIRSWIIKVRSQTGLKPKMISIDYDDCLFPSSGRTGSLYEDSAIVYSDIKQLADFFACPVLTFAQPQREAWEFPEQDKLLQAQNLSHSSMKAFDATSISSINFKEGEEYGILFADLVRRGESKVKITIKRDLERAKFYEPIMEGRR
jgi:hypothetical protein